MIPVLVSHNISNNLQTKRDIFLKNIEECKKFITTDEYQNLKWIDKMTFLENMLAQETLLEYYQARIDNYNNKHGNLHPFID